MTAFESGNGWEDLANIEIKPIRFRERPMWQEDAFHLLVGPKGCGKGTFLAALAARVTRGELGPKRQVLWIAAGEDSLAIDVKPRILVAEGDISPGYVFVPKMRLRLPDDVGAIREQALALRSVGLIVIDPVSGTFSGKRNSNADTEVREALDPLNQLADELETLIVGIRHLGKDRTRGALASVLGSVDWVNVPRAVLAIAMDEDEISHVQVIAGNRVPHGEAGLCFRIVGVQIPGLDGEPVTKAEMLGESARSVEELLSDKRQEPSRSKVARERILDILDTEGRQESDGLDARVAKEVGLEVRTIQNQRKQLRAEGLIRSKPGREESGKVAEWFVERTNAARSPTRAPGSARSPSAVTEAGGALTQTAYTSGKPAPESQTPPNSLNRASGEERASQKPESQGVGESGRPAAQPLPASPSSSSSTTRIARAQRSRRGG